jgi:hypothetical protein
MSNQNEEKSQQSEFQKGSTVEFWKKKGIEAENTTQEKIGQTTLVFTKNVPPSPKEDDSIYASLRYLKYKSKGPK